MALTGRDIVCVSVMDWDHPFPTSRHALMRKLAERNRVLFVDSLQNPVTALRGALRAPSRARLARWAGFLPAMRFEDPLWVLTPPAGLPCAKLPAGPAFEAAYRANQALMRQAVRHAARTLKMERPILWLSFSVLASEGVVGALDESLILYHCTDEISAIPGVPAIAATIEKRLIARSDLVVCSSGELAASRGGLCVPNGVDVELFASARSPEVPLAPRIARLKRQMGEDAPIIGYSGQVDERFDLDLWGALAEARPDWIFAAVGLVSGSLGARCRDLARRCPNVRFLGLVEQTRLPQVLKGFCVATLPWRRTPQTRAIFPLKLHEYLAAGLPVVATPFADLGEASAVVRRAQGVADFLAALEAARADRDLPCAIAARAAIAEGASWSVRLAEIERAIESRLASRPEPGRFRPAPAP